MINFIVYGKPKAKGRPKFARAGKYVRTYKDDKTEAYENLVKLSFLNSGCRSYMNNEALTCQLMIYDSIPKSCSKKKKEQMLMHKILPTKKPDIDNVVKAIFDGLNKVAFNDDTQIIQLICTKYYSEEPRVEVTIKEVNTNE